MIGPGGDLSRRSAMSGRKSILFLREICSRKEGLNSGEGLLDPSLPAFQTKKLKKLRNASGVLIHPRGNLLC